MKKAMIKKALASPKIVGTTLLMTLFLSACSNDSSEVTGQASSETVTSEPAELLVFEHNYDGSTKVSEQERIQLKFLEQYEDGVISITVNETEGLSYQSLSAQSFSLETDTFIPMDLVFTADKVGDYLVVIIVNTSDSDGVREKRIFDIELTVS